MRILVVHNHYLSPGGEDNVFHAEVELLREHGHEIHTWVHHNNEITGRPRSWVAANTIWSRSSQRQLLQILQEFRPDVVHFHNTFLVISPAAYYTCQKFGVPVVQTLHNYRLLCPAATLFRDGKICEDCLSHWGLWPSIQHGCWHSSRGSTAVIAAMLATHRWLKTWQKQVNVFIVLTEFARQKFIDGGLPADKIVVKPNFLGASFTPLAQPLHSASFALFAGRLSPEKGCELLLEAWKSLPTIPLKIIGEGPLRPKLQQFAQEQGLTQVEFCGRQSPSDVLEAMQQARLLVVPSVWYEGMPMVVIEAFSRHLPIIATNIGAMSEIVRHGENGLHYKLNDAADLAHWVRWAWGHPAELSVMVVNAHREFQEKYSRSYNYQLLIDIYQRAMTTPAY